MVTGYVAGITGLQSFYWPSLLAAATATMGTIGIIENGRWRIGILVPPRLAARELAGGTAFAAILIGAADLIVLAWPSMHHVPGIGFPWREMLVVYVPAAIHEEVVFRGYLFQKIRAWHRAAGIASTSVVFAALHAGNRGVNWIAAANLLLAGILLALAWERYRRLWLPIGIHLGWNVFSGPVLGYAISGFVPEESLLRVVGKGPAWLTGGGFGIEGSLAATVVESAGIALMWRRGMLNVKC